MEQALQATMGIAERPRFAATQDWVAFARSLVQQLAADLGGRMQEKRLTEVSIHGLVVIV